MAVAEKTPESVRIAAVQMNPRLADPDHNQNRICEGIRRAAGAGVNLAVFPECALTGYGFSTPEEALPFAIPIPPPSPDNLIVSADKLDPRLAEIAKICSDLNIYTIFGLLEQSGTQLYNACVLLGPEGLIGSYRKIHMPFLGVDAFATPGDRPFAVHTLPSLGLRVGMLICYDASFPESARVLTLLGADLITVATNWPTHSECAAEHVIPCRAHENVVYVMAVNRVGEERGFRFIGRSSVADTTGAFLARGSAETEDFLTADIVPALARQKRLIRVPGKHEIDRIADRHPEFYDRIVKPQ